MTVSPTARYGRGIFTWSTQDVQIIGNSVSHGLGPVMSAIGRGASPLSHTERTH